MIPPVLWSLNPRMLSGLSVEDWCWVACPYLWPNHSRGWTLEPRLCMGIRLLFHLVQRIMPYHVRKQYPKPWLQYIGGSRRESSLKISVLKKTESQIWGEMLWKKTESQHFLDSVYFHNISPHIWDSDFFQSWNFQTPLSPASSCVFEPAFQLWLPDMLWHYSLHQIKLFNDFGLKKSNLMGIKSW